MTDLEKLQALFNEFGVGYKMDTTVNGNAYMICETGDAKIVGYYGFFADFEFNKDGSFIQMGAGE